MRWYVLISLLAFAGCTSSETRTQDTGIEKTVERETSTEKKRGVEAGQPIDVVVTRTVQKDKLTEHEARMQSTTTTSVDVPDISGLGNILGGLATGNWGTVIAALGSMLVGKVIGRKGAEGEMAEITEGVSEFAKANPEAGKQLGDNLSRAMSKNTKKTVRRIKP
jgi:hypothetical protein